jgi:predicted  nucleic acid-binding Zn-ribbon protein
VQPKRQNGVESASELQAPQTLVEQNAALRARITQMRGALDALQADNAQLRRRLAAIESATRKPHTSSATTIDRVRRVREMLRDRGSRNP